MTQVEGVDTSAELGPEYFAPVDTHLLLAKAVRQTFKIQVMQPPGRQADERRYPVVYATDGNASFDMLKGISWLMQGLEREWRPFILVGIGYPGDSPNAAGLLRGRDLTFPGCPDYFSGHPLIRGMGGPQEGTKSFCGGEDFQRFLREELIPFMDATYRTISDDRTYFGHSLGGGFGLFTMLTQPHLFRNYVISSPTLAYHGETPSGVHYDGHDFMMQRVKDLAAEGRSLDSIRLCMSVGTEEELDPLIANWRFTSSFFRMVAVLEEQRIAGLQFTAQAYCGENHLTAWPLAFMRGMTTLFRSHGTK